LNFSRRVLAAANPSNEWRPYRRCRNRHLLTSRLEERVSAGGDRVFNSQLVARGGSEPSGGRAHSSRGSLEDESECNGLDPNTASILANAPASASGDPSAFL